MTEPSSPASPWRVRLWAYAPVVLWIAVIFTLSSPKGSMMETSRFIGPLIHFFFPDISMDRELTIHYYIRKTAHFTEYGLLAILTVRAMFLSGMRRPLLRYVPAILLVLLIASSDEFNQSFEPSRTSSVWDVLLDLTGGVSGTLLAWLWFRRSPNAPPPAAQVPE